MLLMFPLAARAQSNSIIDLHSRSSRLYQLGRYDEAATLLEQLVAVVKSQRGEDHLDFGVTLYNLANVYRALKHRLSWSDWWKNFACYEKGQHVSQDFSFNRINPQMFEDGERERIVANRNAALERERQYREELRKELEEEKRRADQEARKRADMEASEDRARLHEQLSKTRARLNSQDTCW